MSNFQELTDEQLTMVCGGVTQSNTASVTQAATARARSVAVGGIAIATFGDAYANTTANSTATASNTSSITQSNANNS